MAKKTLSTMIVHFWRSQNPKTAIQEDGRRFQVNNTKIKEFQGQPR